MKLRVVLLFALVLMMFPVSVFASDGITVIVDGNKVDFTSEPKYKDGVVIVPAEALLEALNVDKEVKIKNTQMINNYKYVPLRSTSEEYGAYVIWDNDNSIAHITTKENRENIGDTPSNYTDYIPYSTGDLETLLDCIIKGYVVYFDGQYWATPEYANMAANENVVYSNDIADDKPKSLLPQSKKEEKIVDNYIGWQKDDAPEEVITNQLKNSQTKVKSEWVSDVIFKKILAYKKDLNGIDVSTLEATIIPDFYWIYAFTEYADEVLYYVDEMTDEFFNAENAEGTFNGIRMKKENGKLYFNQQDLEKKGLYEKPF